MILTLLIKVNIFIRKLPLFVDLTAINQKIGRHPFSIGIKLPISDMTSTLIGLLTGQIPQKKIGNMKQRLSIGEK